MESILEKIYNLYLESGFKNAIPLSGDDTFKQDKVIKDILNKTNISIEDEIALDDSICSLSCCVERLGFINGIKVGVMLADELGGAV